MLPRRTAGLLLAAALGLGGCSLGPGSGSQGGLAPGGLPAVRSPVAYAPRTAPRAGGVITIGTWQFPSTLSPYFGSQTAAVPIEQAIFDGLVGAGPDLTRYGDLARDVPTPENGGVKPVGAGMDVTYQLRPGLTWSDGQPITGEDVAFTLQAITGAGAGAGVSQQGYNLIGGIDLTPGGGVVVHFLSLYPAYLQLFSAVLPRHRLAGIAPAALPTDPYWSRPDVVSGPFTVQDAGPDRVTLHRNPHYADGRSGMPFLGHNAYADRVVFRPLPSRQAVLAAVEAGDVQAALDLTERELPTIARLTGTRVALVPSLSYEQVSLNQADPNPATGAAPPWAGDPAVAQALDLALDRPGVRTRLAGAPPLTATPLSPLVGWAYAADVRPPVYDIERARRTLDADGWTPGPDGVRVKAGRRLAFVLSGPSDQPLRGTEQDIVAAGWRRLGADVTIQDFTTPHLFASYAQGGVLARGGYEAALWSWVLPPDPDSEFAILQSSSVPGGRSPDAENYSHCHDGAVDGALSDGRATLDLSQRAAAYRAFQAAYVQARCELPLYRRLDIGVSSPRLQNFALNPGLDGNTWNLADWWLG